MSRDLIPPGVAEKDAALLRRAYDLTSQAEGQQLYVEWADTYDITMVDGLGYIAPGLLTERFAAAVSWRDGAVLDLGCGTGLVGVELRRFGFTVIDGTDLSAAMMQQASRRGIYRNLIEADMTQTFPLPDGAYDAALCNGTFTSGHVDASCLPEVLRVIRPGGTFAAAIHNAVWGEFGFRDAIERLVGDGVVDLVEIVESAYYESSPSADGRLCVFTKR